MVSPEALDRKARFLKLKEEHGDFAGIQTHIKDTEWNLWFNHDGDIIALSTEPNSKFSKEFKHTVFTQAQIGILKDKSWSLFRIRTDPKSDTVHYLETRPVDMGVVITHDRFLTLVKPDSKKRIYDIKLALSANKFTVTAHNRLLAKYKGVAPANYTLTRKKELTFHFTSINDPSFLLQTVTIPVVDLISNKQVSRKMETDMRQCSIYTIQNIDKYIRV